MEYGGLMTHRWTLVYQRIEAGPSLRNDGIKRRSSGFRYYLLLPLAGLLLYASMVWSVLVMASYCTGIRRLFR